MIDGGELRGSLDHPSVDLDDPELVAGQAKIDAGEVRTGNRPPGEVAEDQACAQPRDRGDHPYRAADVSGVEAGQVVVGATVARQPVDRCGGDLERQQHEHRTAPHEREREDGDHGVGGDAGERKGARAHALAQHQLTFAARRTRSMFAATRIRPACAFDRGSLRSHRLRPRAAPGRPSGVGDRRHAVAA